MISLGNGSRLLPYIFLGQINTKFLIFNFFDRCIILSSFFKYTMNVVNDSR